MIELEQHAPQAALARAGALDRAARELGDAAEVPLAQALSALARRMAGEPAPALADADRRPARGGRQVAPGRGAEHRRAVEHDRNAFDASRDHAADALAVALAIGDVNEALVAHATLARLARSQGQNAAPQVALLRQVLDAPDGYSARARQAAAAAIDDTTGNDRCSTSSSKEPSPRR